MTKEEMLELLKRLSVGNTLYSTEKKSLAWLIREYEACMRSRE